jgi:MFS family permease
VSARLPLTALVVANATSLVGNVVASVAIPWFVLETTGSAARAGVAAFFTTLPLALGAVFGGAVADRVGARLASIVGDVAGGAAIAAIPALHALGALEFWHLLALAFLASLFDAPAQASREALLQDAAEHARMPLERASAIWTTTEHAGYVLGAPAAGVLIALLDAPGALAIDAASFALSALLVAAAVPAAKRRLERRRYTHDLVEGIRFVGRDAVLRTFLVAATVGNLLIAALAPVLLPVYARRELGGAEDLAVIVAAYGVGGLAGAAAFGAIARRVPRRGLYVAAWLPYPVLWFLLAMLPPLAVAAAVLFLIGVVAGLLGPIEQLVRLRRTPPELRARVLSTFMGMLLLVVPPGVLAGGLLVEWLGLRGALLAFAAANTALTVCVLASRAPRSV